MKTKKVLFYLAIAFAVFYLFSRPSEAANSVKGLLDGIAAAAGQLALFFSRLIS